MLDRTAPEAEAPGVQRIITQVLCDLAAESPDRVLIRWVDDGSTTTYGEIDLLARRWAALFASRRVAAGDRVAILSSNGLGLLGALFGGMYIGAVITPIGVELRGESLRHPLRLFEPRVLVVDEDLYDLALAAAVGTDVSEILTLPAHGDMAEQAGSAEVTAADDSVGLAQELPVPVDPSTPCLIMSTSGTTGPSKGSLWDHGTMSTWAGNYVRQLRYQPEDRIYCCTPLTHANALVSGVMAGILAGCSLVIANRFSVTHFWRHVHENGATTANVLGSMIHLLLKDPRMDPGYIQSSSLRTMLTSSCSAASYRAIKKDWGFTPVCAYGLTDFGTLTSSFYGEDCPSGSCGRALPDFELRLVDGSDQEVEAGEPGELIVRPAGPWRAPQKYFGMPEETVESRRNLWFHTGDLLRRDAEGWFYFVGRKKEALRYRGENVSAHEVEGALLACAEISEAAVYPVASELGEDEIAVAIVATDPGARIELAEITRQISLDLPYFAVPRYFRVVDSLPKNASQRVVKKTLVEAGVTDDTWDRDEAGVVVSRNRARSSPQGSQGTGKPA